MRKLIERIVFDQPKSLETRAAESAVITLVCFGLFLLVVIVAAVVQWLGA